jgi:hypothetical protein
MSCPIENNLEKRILIYSARYCRIIGYQKLFFFAKVIMATTD